MHSTFIADSVNEATGSLWKPLAACERPLRPVAAGSLLRLPKIATDFIKLQRPSTNWPAAVPHSHHLGASRPYHPLPTTYYVLPTAYLTINGSGCTARGTCLSGLPRALGLPLNQPTESINASIERSIHY